MAIAIIKRTKLEGMVRRMVEARGGNLLETGDGFVQYSRPHTDCLLMEEIWNLPALHLKRAVARLEDLAISEGKPLLCAYLRTSRQDEQNHDILLELGFRPIQDSFFLTLYRKELTSGQST